MTIEKTPLMMEVEKRLGRSLETYLTKEYKTYKKSIPAISDNLSVSTSTVSDWMQNYNIALRDRSKAASLSKLGERKRPSKKWLRHQYVDLRRSSSDIAKKIGVTYSSVLRWLDEDDVPVRNNSEAHLEGVKKPSKKWMQHQYLDLKKSTPEIGKKLDVSANCVLRWLRGYEIKVRDSGESNLKRGYRPNKTWFEEQYVVRRRNIGDIADELEVERQTVRHWMNNYKISRRSKSEEKLKGKELPSKKWVQHHYVKLEESINELGKKAGLSNTVIYKLLDTYGIRKRDKTEAMRRFFWKDKKIPSKKWMQRQYVTLARDQKEIADEIGVSYGALTHLLNRYEIQRRNRSEGRRLSWWKGKKIPSKKWMQEKYINLKMSAHEIGKIVGVSDSTIHGLLSTYKIPKRTVSEERLKHKEVPTKEKIMELYLGQHLNIDEIAVKLDFSEGLISRLMKKYDIPVRGIGYTSEEKKKKLEELLKGWLEDGR